MSTGDLAQRLWNNAGQLKGPEVEAYYAWRGVAVPETDSLRFVASLPHKSGASFPGNHCAGGEHQGRPDRRPANFSCA